MAKDDHSQIVGAWDTLFTFCVSVFVINYNISLTQMLFLYWVFATPKNIHILNKGMLRVKKKIVSFPTRNMQEHKLDWQIYGTICTKSGPDQCLKLDSVKLHPTLLALTSVPLPTKLAFKGEWNEAFMNHLFTIEKRNKNQIKQLLWCLFFLNCTKWLKADT